MSTEKIKNLSYEEFKANVIKDYCIAYTSRQISVISRKEVLSGRAKFGILGDGKELPQVALAKFFQAGDFRAGYYRDQTLMLALGIATPETLFAQTYGDSVHDPFSKGRQMSNHFSTPFIDKDGNLQNLTELKNSTSDLGPVACQVPRALGLGLTSKIFRNNPNLKNYQHISHNGNEVCFCSIGDASTSEGHFFEAVNAAGILQIPLVFLVWDDGYGISVPKNQQTTKASISKVLEGFKKEENSNGLNIRSVKGWDYPQMCIVFEEIIHQARTRHIPAVIHVEELVQPLGHSTSGSHERYKDKTRLDWEKEWDGIKKMREWIIDNKILSHEELLSEETEIEQSIQTAKETAWQKYYIPIQEKVTQCTQLLTLLIKENSEHPHLNTLQHISQEFLQPSFYSFRNILRCTHQIQLLDLSFSPTLATLQNIEKELKSKGESYFNTDLYQENGLHTLATLSYTPGIFDGEERNGYEILNQYFDTLFKHNPLVVALGEDVGKIGGVNQAFAGLQEKYSDKRIMDTGIRELSIMGKGIGMALRGLRPIAEIQYLDYLLFGLQPLSDDAATTSYRTGGTQACPLIVRTRGHRFIGIFHSGSPMQMLLGSLRGMFLCVPRNMVQAVGMYNTLLKTNIPAVLIECLNGYRTKELVPKNLLEFTLPLGVPEIIREGTDITIVSYGATLKIVMEAVDILTRFKNISCEIIDVQTLLPFDTNHIIGKSLQKTNKILFVDEDVTGGASSYMLQHVIEKQNGYRYLDTKPHTLTAKDHRPAYGPDGDYFSKPNTEDIINKIVSVIAE